MKCPCGQWMTNGKCGQCDTAALRRPFLRGKAVERKVRRQEQTLRSGMGISAAQSRKGFTRAKEKLKIVEQPDTRWRRRS